MTSKQAIHAFIILLAATALFGCAHASLTTRVEVYNPESRAAQLGIENKCQFIAPVSGTCEVSQLTMWPRNKQELALYLERRNLKEKLGDKPFKKWIGIIKEQINNTKEAPDAIETHINAIGNVENDGLLSGVKKFYKDKCQEVRNKYTGQLDDVTREYNDENTSRDIAIATVNQILSDFVTEYKGVLTTEYKGVLKDIPTGDPSKSQDIESRLKTVIQGIKDNVVINKVVKEVNKNVALQFKGFKLEDYTANAMTNLTNTAHNTTFDQEGVLRPDSVIETTTDPLIPIALEDKAGWTPTVTRTDSFAEGKCEFAIIRDASASFSIYSVRNDPSEIVKSTLNMAESTLSVVAQIATSYFGLPAPKPNNNGGATPPPTADEQGGMRYNKLQLQKLADIRLKRTETLISNAPDVNVKGDIDDNAMKNIDAWVKGVRGIAGQCISANSADPNTPK